ncbi:RNA-binding protein 42 [Trypanosoma cruzi cruzi]|nr:RNA-binding protein 42 [Trypanosoma cruzi cruzi]
MLTSQEVACQFIPAFFERLASNPAELAEMYGPNSSLTIVDFVYGTTEVRNEDVPRAVEQWAQILQGCELCVESYSAVPLYGGVSVYVTMFAESKTTRHYFQFVNILEAYGAGAYGSEAYFIRHQILIRPGSAETEQPEPEVTPDQEPKLEVSPEAVESSALLTSRSATDEERKEQQQQKKNTTVVGLQAAAVAAAATPDKTAAVESETAATVQRQQPPVPSKPKTWASLASAQPKGEQRQPLRVIIPENGVNADATEVHAPAKPTQTEQRHTSSSAGGAGATKPPAKFPRSPAVSIGDRLMFNIDYEVSDEEIKTAFGPLAANIVSLRNNSANGHVFLDFSDKEKVMDIIKANPPTVGARKTRVSIYRQRTRQQGENNENRTH